MKTYPLTPEQFNQLRTRLLQLGITLPDGNDGEIAHGSLVTLGYHYDPPNLNLTILKKSVWVSENRIWNAVADWLNPAV